MLLKLHFGKDVIELNVPESVELVAQLCEFLEGTVDVPSHKMKLIVKGQVLLKDKLLSSYNLKDGSKLMMLANGFASQGQKMAQELAAKNTAAAESRKKAYQRSLQQEIQAAPKKTFAQRIQKWRETGIVSLRGLELTCLPTGLDDLGPSIYAVDVGDNDLTALPDSFLDMPGLQRLRCSHNRLVTSSLPWTSISLLPKLSHLMLSHNRLESIAPVLCQLNCLRELDISENRLSTLPDELGLLTNLTSLNADGNQLTLLPASIGSCSNLQTLRANENKIKDLPDTLSQLKSLFVLSLVGNRVQILPPGLLRDATSLHSLLLQDNPITMQQLRDSEGFEDFSERRKGKLDKIVDMRVDVDFEEAADYERHRRH